MVSKIARQQARNFFKVIGNLCDNPQKGFTVDSQLFVFFKVRTRFNNSYVDVPIIITGSTGDAFATKYKAGDLIYVEGMFINLDNKIQLWTTHHKLIKQSKKKPEVIDNFKKTVELYSLDAIDRRDKQWEERIEN